ncbi:high mobility group box domain-containing protein, partial [Trametes polyzona]
MYEPYKNATSKRRYKAKRQQDPNWAPRPPNAFILFRRDYVEKHKGENVVPDKKEKTLSKRASLAWHTLSDEEKKPWYEQAKLEALKHAQANPGYVFRP